MKHIWNYNGTHVVQILNVKHVCTLLAMNTCDEQVVLYTDPYKSSHRFLLTVFVDC